MTQQKLLDGIRVLDLTRVMSGPFCTAMLSDIGADVIKVERPGVGDEGRHFAPYKEGVSTYFALLNRGKKSVAIDLKTEAGRSIVRRLAKQCDVVVENFRPGVADKLGLGYAALKAGNERLVYASISGFGQDSPYAKWPAFDLVIQAMSGLMSVTGRPSEGPTAVGESVADVVTGIFASWGILAALVERERTGKGGYIDVGMLDSTFSLLLTSLSRDLFGCGESRRVGNRHPETYPVDSFEAKDGEAFVIVCFSDAAFRSLAHIMGRPEIIDDPGYSTNQARNDNEDALRAMIAEWAHGLSREEALKALSEGGIPCGPVLGLRDVLKSPHAEKRQLVVDGFNSKLGSIPVVPQPVHFLGYPRMAGRGRAPELGEDTDAVLADYLGASSEEVAMLRKANVVA